MIMKNLFKISLRSVCEDCRFYKVEHCLKNHYTGYLLSDQNYWSFHRKFYYWFDDHIYTPLTIVIEKSRNRVSDKTLDVFQESSRFDLFKWRVLDWIMLFLIWLKQYIKGDLTEPELKTCWDHEYPYKGKKYHIGTIEPIKYEGDKNPEELLSFINGCIIKYPKSNGYKYIDMNGDIVEYIRKLLSPDKIKSSIAILNHSKISN